MNSLTIIISGAIPSLQVVPVHCGSHKQVRLFVQTPLIHCGLHNAVTIDTIKFNVP